MRGLGQGVSEFKKGTREVAEPIKEVKDALLGADGKIISECVKSKISS